MRTIVLVLFVLSSVFMVSCKKKEQSGENLTPMNAVEKYGGVMSKTLKKSKAMDGMMYIKNKINTFQMQEGRYPSSLNELVEKRYLDKLPEPPKGMTFNYDPATGNIDVK